MQRGYRPSRAIRAYPCLPRPSAWAAKRFEQDGRIGSRAAQRGNHAVLPVDDDGIGTTAETRPSIFELFTGRRQNMERLYGSLGPGLAIARTRAGLHAREPSAMSAGPRHGSACSLARRPAPEGLAPSAVVDARPKASDTPPGRAVLIVDDNADTAAMLSELLNDWGYATHVAHDGPSALRLLGESTIDVALLDIGLPVMDGYQLAEQIRQEPCWRSVRLVALTGYGQDADRAKARECGFDEHLAKPVDLDLLARILR